MCGIWHAIQALARLLLQICYPLPPYLFNMVLKVLGKAIRQGDQWDTNSKAEGKMSIFVDDMIAYISNPKTCTKEFL